MSCAMQCGPSRKTEFATVFFAGTSRDLRCARLAAHCVASRGWVASRLQGFVPQCFRRGGIGGVRRGDLAFMEIAFSDVLGTEMKLSIMLSARFCGRSPEAFCGYSSGLRMAWLFSCCRTMVWMTRLRLLGPPSWCTRPSASQKRCAGPLSQRTNMSVCYSKPHVKVFGGMSAEQAFWMDVRRLRCFADPAFRAQYFLSLPLCLIT